MVQRRAQVHRVQHQDIVLTQAIDDIDAPIVVIARGVGVNTQQIDLGLSGARRYEGGAAGGEVGGGHEQALGSERRGGRDERDDGHDDDAIHKISPLNGLVIVNRYHVRVTR